MGRSQGWFWSLRWVMVLLGLAIAAVLLLRGSYVLGLLIAGLAVVRAVFAVGISRRRRAFRDVFESGGTRSVLREMAPAEFMLASRMVGLDPPQARRAVNLGSSLADLASRAGVPVERMIDAIVSDASDKIRREVSDGRLRQDQATRVEARLPIWANRLVHFRQAGAPGTGRARNARPRPGTSASLSDE